MNLIPPFSVFISYSQSVDKEDNSTDSDEYEWTEVTEKARYYFAVDYFAMEWSHLPKCLLKVHYLVSLTLWDQHPIQTYQLLTTHPPGYQQSCTRKLPWVLFSGYISYSSGSDSTEQPAETGKTTSSEVTHRNSYQLQRCPCDTWGQMSFHKVQQSRVYMPSSRTIHC